MTLAICSEQTSHTNRTNRGVMDYSANKHDMLPGSCETVAMRVPFEALFLEMAADYSKMGREIAA